MSEDAFKKGFEAGWFAHSSGRMCSLEDELIEAVKDFSWGSAPEATKVEREPVGKIDYSHQDGLRWIYKGKPPADGTLLYTHPAPASDELLEALEVIQDKLKFCTDEGPEGEGWLSKELERAWGIVSDYINQHKGPQP